MVDAPDSSLTPVDRMIRLWQQVLRTEDITAEDDFFDLGGNSIVAVRLLPLIEERFGADLELSVIFDHPTPRELVQALAGLGPVTRS